MYSHAPENYHCPFCLLLQGIQNKYVASVNTDLIYSNDEVTALISSHQWPNNPGNVIIIPNDHFENIYDLPDHYVKDIHITARMIAIAMKAVFSCDGISTRQHNEPDGNQDVWHYHVHVTPRYNNDQFYATMGDRALMPVDMRATHANLLREHMLGLSA